MQTHRDVVNIGKPSRHPQVVRCPARDGGGDVGSDSVHGPKDLENIKVILGRLASQDLEDLGENFSTRIPGSTKLNKLAKASNKLSPRPTASLPWEEYKQIPVRQLPKVAERVKSLIEAEVRRRRAVNEAAFELARAADERAIVTEKTFASMKDGEFNLVRETLLDHDLSPASKLRELQRITRACKAPLIRTSW